MTQAEGYPPSTTFDNISSLVLQLLKSFSILKSAQ